MMTKETNSRLEKPVTGIFRLILVRPENVFIHKLFAPGR